jgi:dTDP-glucose 4,6-dehydratase
MQQILVTGGCGFIGSEFIRQQLTKSNRATIVNLDKLTSTGNLETLADFARYPHYIFHRGDITDRDCVETLLARYSIDAVVNFADENRVDCSLQQSTQLVNTNVVGTQVLLDAARNARVYRYLQVSTDEVYGRGSPLGKLTEDSPISPENPYSASKAAADVLVRAYHQSFGFPSVIARSSTNYGPFQSTEALLPFIVTSLMSNQPIVLDETADEYCDWIHVSDFCRGIDAALNEGQTGGIYLFGGSVGTTIHGIAQLLLEILGGPGSLINSGQVHSHRNIQNCPVSKRTERELGWQPWLTLLQGLQETIDWYTRHPDWVANIKHNRQLAAYSGRSSRRSTWTHPAQSSLELHQKPSERPALIS